MALLRLLQARKGRFDLMARTRLRAVAAFLVNVVLAGCTLIQPGRSTAPVDPELGSGQEALDGAEVASEARIEPFTVQAWVYTDQMSASCHQPDIHGDILDRIRAGFALPRSEDQAIARQVNLYASYPDYLNRVFTRSMPYIHHIVEEIAARGMPMELALLPVVESAYDPFAYSRGRAAGLWQFIPGTGRIYDLKQNWWYDGRRDITASTRAALDYLEDLYKRFEGDWILAIAAYNSGEGNVAKAIRRNARTDKPTEFWHLRLPRETRAYIPKLLAMRELVSDPAKHGVKLPRLPDRPYFAEVATPSQIDLAVAAELAGIEVEQLHTLNPGFNRWATDPEGPHRLLIPIANRSQLEAGLKSLPEHQRLQWNRYKVRAGDTLSMIAHRHGTTVAALKKVNRTSGNTIRVGQALMIPKPAKTPESYTLSTESRLKRTQDKERRGTKSSYLVKRGDTLWDIAMTHSVSTRKLAVWNGMATTDTLSVGKKLVVWSNGQVSPIAETPGSLGKLRRIDYVIRRGDSLSRISSKFKVSVSQLRRWNARVAKQKYLQPGQRLVMYVDVTRQSG